jgi:hydrogenase large subunit
MSHITHLYHLSAADFIDFTNTIVPMSPWLPSYTASDMGRLNAATKNTLILNYVEALNMRRKMHTASALFSGRHPIQNAMVPGGVTTLWHASTPAAPLSGTDYDMYGPYNATDTVAKFNTLLNDVRTFINTKYIPNVVTVANTFSEFWYAGTGTARVLAYGDYPTTTGGNFLIKRGLVTVTSLTPFSQTSIREYVDYSWYGYGALDPAGLHPFDGKTTVNHAAGDKYSWLKAPRLLSSTDLPLACEVGPLARMLATALSTTQQTVSDTVVGGTSLGEVVGTASLGGYNALQLVTTALTLVPVPGGGANSVTNLYSALGRHAARALEAKYVADAMAIWVGQLNPANPTYTYVKIPKQIATGYGLAEAPRGALGHWIKIEGRKVAKYQCVVPSTWNFSPSIAPNTAESHKGPVENSLIGTNIGSGSDFTARSQQIVNILRLVHPFDCCIACAVHVVNPEGKEVMKFAIDPDGRPSNIEIAE